MLISLTFLPSPSSFSTFFVQTKGSAPLAAPTRCRCCTTLCACGYGEREARSNGEDRGGACAPDTARHALASQTCVACAHSRRRSHLMSLKSYRASAPSYASCAFLSSPSCYLPLCMRTVRQATRILMVSGLLVSGLLVSGAHLCESDPYPEVTHHYQFIRRPPLCQRPPVTHLFLLLLH